MPCYCRKIILFALWLFIGKVGYGQVTVTDSTLQDADDKSDLEDTAPLDEAVDMDQLTSFKIGGALRYNYQYRDWSPEHKDQIGDFTFDTWRINVDGQASGVLLSLEYRFYSGYHMFHHGWFGYNLSPNTQLQVGINQVPFGNLPYTSHSWWFTLPYFLGFEDDYDMGAKIRHRSGGWDLALAFYKSAEPTLSGSSQASARYSYDVVPTSIIKSSSYYTIGDSFNSNTPGPDEDSTLVPAQSVNDTVVYSSLKEINHLNARVAYEIGSFEVGASLQSGWLYDQDIQEKGYHWATALHANGDIGRFNLIAEFIHYDYQIPEGSTTSTSNLVMGAYDYPYQAATSGQVYVAGVSYTLPVSWGPVKHLTFYEDYSLLNKSVSGYPNSQQNVVGCLIGAGQMFTYIDIASGNNHPWLGPFGKVWDQGLATGEASPEPKTGRSKWRTRININMGYYF